MCERHFLGYTNNLATPRSEIGRDSGLVNPMLNGSTSRTSTRKYGTVSKTRRIGHGTTIVAYSMLFTYRLNLLYVKKCEFIFFPCYCELLKISVNLFFLEIKVFIFELFIG